MKHAPPIIVIGMHRSGTSLIGRILETLGIFMGWGKDQNNEAIFFQRLNEWVLRQSGGAWDHPQPVKQLLRNVEIRSLVEDYFSLMLNSPRMISYLGWRKFLLYRSLFRLEIPWGWKDPRNTFTLPLWLKFFPGARVLHVCRHGVDVAKSLLVRQRRSLVASRHRYQKLKRLRTYWVWPKREGFTGTVRCAALEGGFSLWEEYMQEAESHVRELDTRAMVIKFEYLLANPVEALSRLIEFCGLEPSEKLIAKAIGRVKPGRAYAYRRDERLRLFAQKVSHRLKAYGYEP